MPINTAFQWVFNHAESLSIDNRDIVMQTITRDETVRATSYGQGKWKFTVKLPDGMPWDVNASYIQTLDNQYLLSEGLISFDNTTYPNDVTDGFQSWLLNGDLYSPTYQTWTVRCVEMPQWNIFQRNQVSWSGSFVFYEV